MCGPPIYVPANRYNRTTRNITETYVTVFTRLRAAGPLGSNCPISVRHGVAAPRPALGRTLAIGERRVCRMILPWPVR